MNKSESKYFHTAVKMDKAFLALLEKKDFAYITVKEICTMAGVNRSTFYLHYETISDLLAESVSYMNEQFLAYMKEGAAVFVQKLYDCPKEELYLITPEYLAPYLNYIKDHKRLFRTATENASVLDMEQTYFRMNRYVFTPILERYQVPECEREYLMAFYIRGLMGIIARWLEHDCTDSIDHIMRIMQQCVMPHKEEL